MSRADFVEMTTTSIAGTAGNGAVTCSAVTGLPGFTNAFGAGTRLIDYVIEDTVNLFFEKGYGSVAANVLTRINVNETWDGTTYLSVNAVPLAFGATPASGNIRVRIAATSDAFMPSPPATQTTLGTNTYLGYQFSNHLSPAGNPGAGSALGTTLEYYAPFLSLTRGKLDGIGLDVATVGTTGIKAALYECGTDGLPGPCITQFNAISTTATGFKTDTAAATWGVNAGPIRLGVGWFYVGLMAGDATAAIKKTATSSGSNTTLATPPSGYLSDGYGYGAYAQKAQQNTYATGLPTGTPAGTYTMRNGAAGLFLPLIFLRINNS